MKRRLAVGLWGACWLWMLGGCRGSEGAQPREAPSPEPPPAASEASPTSEASPASEAKEASGPSIHALTMKRLDGTETSLSEWKGKTLLVVNTASKCGHTPQYEGLQALHDEYAAKGFAVLGFPSNDFGGQEPGSSGEIATFCTNIYGIKFPMFEKIKTKGPDRAPLYALLGDALGAPQWNFHKYLVDAEGRPVRAWPSGVKPRSPEIVEAIEKQLASR